MHLRNVKLACNGSENLEANDSGEARFHNDVPDCGHALFQGHLLFEPGPQIRCMRFVRRQGKNEISEQQRGVAVLVESLPDIVGQQRDCRCNHPGCFAGISVWLRDGILGSLPGNPLCMQLSKQGSVLPDIHLHSCMFHLLVSPVCST